MSCEYSSKKEPNKQPRRCYRAPASLRYVEPFSIASFYKNVKVVPPRKINIFEQRNVNTSLFRTLVLRGDIPCQRSFRKPKDNKYGNILLWKVAPQDLDYSCYLPVFFEGLCESEFPYNMLACYGIHDLLNAGANKVLPVIPQIIIPLKNALNTRNRRIIVASLRVIQHLCMCDPCIGPALVPYFRQILASIKIFCNKNTLKLDRIDYNRSGRLGDVIDQTLMLLEHCGGPNAFINIKYAIPTYESCVNN